MTQTLQSRVEIFATAIIEGKTQADAYRLAYPASKNWDNQKVAQKASVFARSKPVKERIADLRAKAAQANEIRATDILAELKRLAFFDIRKLVDAEGNPLPVNQLPDDVAAALVGLDIVQFGNADAGRGTVMKIKMADKLGALTTLARHLGLLSDKLKIGEDQDNPLSSLLAFLQAGAGRIKPGGAK